MIRNKIFYFCLLAYGIVFAILYDEYTSFVIVAALFFIPAILLLLLFFTVPFITVSLLDHTEIVEKGECGRFVLRLFNRSFFPIANANIEIFYGNEFFSKQGKKIVVVSIDGKSEQEIIFNLKMSHCGTVYVGFEGIRVYDYLRLFSVKRKIQKKFSISVLPEWKEMNLVPFLDAEMNWQDSNIYSKNKAGDDPSEVFQIRSYLPGDKIHRIHWKLSSKSGKYMVKEFSFPVANVTILFLELFYNKTCGDIYTCMDQLLESVFSFSYTLLLKKCLHFVAWYDQKDTVIKRVEIENEESIYDLMGQILQVKTYEDASIFPNTYISVYGQEKMANTYYMGYCGIKHFEENGIYPEVIEKYEE